MSAGLQFKNGFKAHLVPAKFLIFPSLQLVTIALILQGAGHVWIGAALFSSLALACDWIPDTSKVEELADLKYSGPPILYTSALLQLVLVLCVFWVLSTQEVTLLHVIGAAATLGVFNGAAGGNLAHEFMHRLNRLDVTIARALSAMALHSTFAIDHINTHHIESTRLHDSASANRGQNFWAFAVHSFLASNRNAAISERKRLAHRNMRVVSLSNRALLGHGFEIIYLATAGYLAGLPGFLAAIGGGVISVILIEGFNYIAHYGLIRTDTGPYEPRHAWSTRRVISSGFTFNITQHSQHHLHPGWHFWEIEAQPDMPVLPLGPSLLSAIAAIPPVWHRYMRPHLERWDRDYASPEELRLRDSLFAAGLKREPRDQPPSPEASG